MIGKPEFTACTWNLRGKGLSDLADLWQGNIRCPEFLFLQELGACSGATPEVQVSDFQLGSSLYTLYLCSSPEAHLSQAILVHSSLGFHATHKCGLPVGLVVHGACHNHRIHLACLHLPHSKRAGSEHKPRATSEEVWQESLEKLDAALEAASPADSLIIGSDFNLDLRAPSDSFAGMSLLRTVIHTP